MNSGLLSGFLFYLCVIISALDFVKVNGNSAANYNAIRQKPKECKGFYQSECKSSARNVMKNNRGCQLPKRPIHGQWKITNGKEKKPGEMVKAYTIIKFTCDAGYKLSTRRNLVICMADEWSETKMPDCLKLCPALSSSDTTFVKCWNREKNEIRCSQAIDGISAEFRCAPYYEPVDNVKLTRYCNNGLWNLPRPLCQPVCGKKTILDKKLIPGGQVPIQQYPWVSAIYHNGSSNFRYVCEGTILTPKIILTAAQCVTNDYGELISHEKIKIGVGKYYSNYKDPRDTRAQYVDVRKFIIHKNYKAEKNRFAFDIAFIVAKKTLRLSNVVQPVCFQNLPNIHLHKGSVGVISGWMSSPEKNVIKDNIRKILMLFERDEKCLEILPSDWSGKYYTFDKMCAKNFMNGTTLCKGISGGGLTFRNRKDSRYYVHGIASVGPRKTGSPCTTDIALFTRVATYYDWMEEVTLSHF